MYLCIYVRHCVQLFCSLSSGNVDSFTSSMTGTCWDMRVLRYADRDIYMYMNVIVHIHTVSLRTYIHCIYMYM